MPSPSAIIDRIRSLGANVTIDSGRLVIVNRQKLPAEALAYIRAHAKEIASWLEREAEFEERAAIIEYDGGLTRAVSEYLTRLLMASPPAGADPADWSWFVSEAARAVDGAGLRRAA
ncbi:MAG TPA: hypothetical protein VFS39_00445 [Nitrospira sp.]|nr:hypothetical protein [Nitrospira sp.]